MVPSLEYVVTPLAACMIYTAFMIVELRNLRFSAYAYMAQALLLVGVFLGIAVVANEPHFYVWSLTAFLSKVIVVPWLVLRAIGKVKVEREEEPLVPLVPSIGVDLALIAIGFWLGETLPIPVVEPGLKICMGVSFALTFMGIYSISSRRSTIKQAISFCHIENGIHLMLAVLAFASPVTVELGILTDAIFAIAMMLYLSTVIKGVIGSLNSFELSSLRW